MKISCILPFLSLLCVDATHKHLRTASETDNGNESSLIRNNRDLQSKGDGCASTPQYRYKGPSTLISVTGSPFPAQGDVSIAEELTPTSAGYPKIKAICTLTAVDPFSSAPFCNLETTVDSSGDRIMSMGTPPFLSIMGGTGSFEGAYGTMMTDETFENAADGTISFGAIVNYCLPRENGTGGGGSGEGGGDGGGNPPCTDSQRWNVRHDGRKRSCSWVAKRSSKRCTLMGKDNDKSEMAMNACQAACLSC